MGQLSHRKGNDGIMAAILIALLWSCPSTVQSLPLFWGTHALIFGPEFYRLRRTRDSGAEQHGVLSGARAVYQRYCPGGLYAEGHASYTHGLLSGATPSGQSLRSEMNEVEYKGRLGWAFHWDRGLCTSLTPFLSGGYFRGRNQFQPPTPIEIESEESYKYSGAGLAITVRPACCFTTTLLFEAQTMLEAENKISNDPVWDDRTILMGCKTHYLAELWLRYRLCCEGTSFDLSLIPFYHYKVFGEHEDVPFIFFETTFRLVGARILIAYRF